ncbi:MAG: NfeD family protein [Gemmataceae bacterium]
MLRWVIGLCVLAVLIGTSGVCGSDAVPAPPARPVYLAQLNDQSINPLTARYIRRAIQQAEQEGAECLILMLDTPGGLVDSTRAIVKDILGSKVPVVVYVAPSGARAASAGLFITLAGHVAAMAPGTNIGAAHPVQVGGLPGTAPDEDKNGKKDSRPPMEDKILHDTVAWAKALAKERGRNEEWAVRAVRESISAPAHEALEVGVIDLIAKDPADLLQQLHGRTVKLSDRERQLHTAGSVIRPVDMWWGERFLAVLANPTVALLLIIFGFYGILFELYSPGWGVGGTLGVICLLLGFFGIAVLPVNYVGLALIAVGLGLFVAEVFVISYGALTIAGCICLVLGGTMLIESPEGFQDVSLWVLVPVALATALITLTLLGNVWRVHHEPVQTGEQSLLAHSAISLQDFAVNTSHFTGMVRISGELWKAVSTTPIASGQEVEVYRRDGLTLWVRPRAASSATEMPANPNPSRS